MFGMIDGLAARSLDQALTNLIVGISCGELEIREHVTYI